MGYVTKFTEVSESWIIPLCVSYISYLYMKKKPCVGNWSEPYLFKAILSNNNSIKPISFTTSFKNTHKHKAYKTSSNVPKWLLNAIPLQMLIKMHLILSMHSTWKWLISSENCRNAALLIFAGPFQQNYITINME